MLLDSASGDFDISGEVTVQSYTAAATGLVVVRAGIGSAAKGVAGGSVYEAVLLVDDVAILPRSAINVPSGTTRFVIGSGAVALESGQTLKLNVLGLEGDTDVGVASAVFDATPLRPSVAARTLAVDASGAVATDAASRAAITGGEGDTLASLAAAVDGLVGAGDGSVPVNHDTGGTDALRYVTAEGAGIDNAVVRAYLKTDYDAGSRAPAFVRATSITGADGRWTRDMRLDPGTYVIEFTAQGRYGPDTQEVVVS